MDALIWNIIDLPKRCCMPCTHTHTHTYTPLWSVESKGWGGGVRSRKIGRDKNQYFSACSLNGKQIFFWIEIITLSVSLIFLLLVLLMVWMMLQLLLLYPLSVMLLLLLLFDVWIHFWLDGSEPVYLELIPFWIWWWIRCWCYCRCCRCRHCCCCCFGCCRWTSFLTRCSMDVSCECGWDAKTCLGGLQVKKCRW